MTVDVHMVLGAFRDHAASGPGGHMMLVNTVNARAVVDLVAGLVRGDDDARTTAASALGIDLDGEEQ